MGLNVRIKCIERHRAAGSFPHPSQNMMNSATARSTACGVLRCRVAAYVQDVEARPADGWTLPPTSFGIKLLPRSKYLSE